MAQSWHRATLARVAAGQSSFIIDRHRHYGPWCRLNQLHQSCATGKVKHTSSFTHIMQRAIVALLDTCFYFITFSQIFRYLQWLVEMANLHGSKSNYQISGSITSCEVCLKLCFMSSQVVTCVYNSGWWCVDIWYLTFYTLQLPVLNIAGQLAPLQPPRKTIVCCSYELKLFALGHT